MSDAYFYAQINDNNVVIGVSQLAGKVDATHMISIPTYDLSLLGKAYDEPTKTFIDKPVV